MSKKNKINRDVVPEDFTLSLVIVDAIPVVCFGLSMIVISMMLGNWLLILGATMCLFAGICKVIWKLIVVVKSKNIWWLFIQMRIVMPIGMLIMIASLFVIKSAVGIKEIMVVASQLPQLYFFIAGIAGMILMIVFAFRLDSSDVKANWIEQFTNGIAQLCILIGLILVKMKL